VGTEVECSCGGPLTLEALFSLMVTEVFLLVEAQVDRQGLAGQIQ
jgi:hypothetical protein